MWGTPALSASRRGPRPPALYSTLAGDGALTPLVPGQQPRLSFRLQPLGFECKFMRRLTASFLMLLALAGILAPLAVAATAPPPHACCVRSAHHCNGPSASDPGQPNVSNTGCCNHDCCRAVTTAQWADAQPQVAPSFRQTLTGFIGRSYSNSPTTEVLEFQSTRAPPQSPIA